MRIAKSPRGLPSTASKLKIPSYYGWTGESRLQRLVVGSVITQASTRTELGG